MLAGRRLDPLPNGVSHLDSENQDDVLLDRPSAGGSFYGMHCPSPCIAASFMLTASYNVSQSTSCSCTSYNEFYHLRLFTLEENHLYPRMPTLGRGSIYSIGELSLRKLFDSDFTLIRVGSNNLRPSKSPVVARLNQTPSSIRVRSRERVNRFKEARTPCQSVTSESR